tara:strand:+ start:268 stop:996 length:729 start_codon:yes stop_codon:yes gene_type:complete
MAISVDTVYQKVLALANKEQRGYITPQEYNLLASQAQLEMFEQYFYDIDIVELKLKENTTEYSDRINVLNEKIAPFQKTNVDMSAVSGANMTLPTSTTVHKLGTVFYNDSTKSIKVERIEAEEAELMQQTALYAATQLRPVYVRRSASTLQFYPSSASPAYSTSTVNCNYIAKPTTPNWGYTVVNDQAMYNSSASTDFELHASEESELVYKILELAGIILNKPGLVQLTDKEQVEIKNKKLI